MIKTAARKDFVKHTLPVWIDLTPPEISYEIKQNSLESGRLIVTITDKLSGLDPDKTEITPVDNPISVGAPILQNESKPPAIKENKQKLFYDVLFPTFVPNNPNPFQIENLIDFSIKAENSGSDAPTFAIASGIDKSGLPFQIAMGFQLGRNLLKMPCSSSGGHYSLNGVFDFDISAPDLTLIVYPQNNGTIQGTDITGVSGRAGGVDFSESLVHKYQPAQADQLLNSKGRSSPDGILAKKLFLEGIQANNQKKINQAWNALLRMDGSPSSVAQIGYNQKTIQANMAYYKPDNPTLHELIRVGLLKQQQFPPKNTARDQYGTLMKSGGYAYLFSLDLDRLGGNIYEKTSANGFAEITINIKGESIHFILNKVDPNQTGANWKVSCHAEG